MADGSRCQEINVTDVGNNTPLHKACERNSTLKVVKLLLECGASLTAKNNNGETALDMAIKNDKNSIAAYLRGVGAKPALVRETKKPGSLASPRK